MIFFHIFFAMFYLHPKELFRHCLTNAIQNAEVIIIQ